MWWNSSCAISNPKRWCYESAALNMPANWENSAVATGLQQVSFHSTPKECSNSHTIALISHASKVMLKVLQARFQQYVKLELPDVQAGCRKGRGTKDQIANIHWIIKKARDLEKHVFLLYWLHQSFDCVDHNEKFWKRLEYRPPDLPLEKSVCRSGSNS